MISAVDKVPASNIQNNPLKMKQHLIKTFFVDQSKNFSHKTVLGKGLQ
jgi:hypothetical protein